MGLQYKHLSELERDKIEALRRVGASYAAIARAIGRNRSTVMRECKRGLWAEFGYSAVFGQRHYARGRQHAGALRRKLGSDLNCAAWQRVRQGLRLHWSPQQIAGRLRALDPLRGPLLAGPDYISHETIYRAIYGLPRSVQRTELVQQLRQSRSGRRRRSRGRRRFTGLQNITPIGQRPHSVLTRLEPGHWEGDLLEGARGSSAVIATLVERSSRLVRLVKLDNASSAAMLRGVRAALRGLPATMRQTLTYDRGTEMALHEQLAQQLNISIYFCDPYCPWQRGTNENTNGLLRQYLPKGTELGQLTQRQLQAIEYLLNNRPRRILAYRTPQEVFDQLSRRAQVE